MMTRKDTKAYRTGELIAVCLGAGGFTVGLYAIGWGIGRLLGAH